MAIYHPFPDSRQKKQPQKQLIGSAQRALTILELVAAHPAGFTPKQVSRAEGNRPARVIKVKEVAAAASRALKIMGYANPAALVEAAQ